MTEPIRPDATTLVTPTPGSRPSGPRAPALADGTVLSDRFRIVRFIARGGMGEVYEAEDGTLGGRVALKTIRPDVADDDRSMERFLREVHLSRSVTHPNVCRIFDVFHHGSVTFLTMELLPGESLADRLRRSGRLAPAEALPLAEQMAAALDAAHEAGIIHRDFKSGNVMLVPDERRPGGVRAVVTDFGLARRSRSDSASAAPLTRTEAVIGTPDYMAPEQIEGRELTPAADIYALGIVLYEMVTGEPPFRGDTPLSVALKKLQEAPPSPRRGAPDLPSTWERAILRCLERRPADRFQTASEVVRALRGERLATGPAQRRRRIRLAAIAAGALIAALAAGYLALRHRASPAGGASWTTRARAPRRSIAVLGFKNLAGRPEAAWVSTALSEMLTTELAAGETLRAVSSEEVARTRVDLSLAESDTLGRDTLAKVRSNLGADLVLLGSYLDTGSDASGTLRIDLRLQDTAAGETIAVVSEKGSEGELDAVVSRAGARLREKLGLSAVSSTETAAVRASLPSNPEAARHYAEGLAKLRVFEDEAARASLERAIAADPRHALAHSALAEAWSGLGWDERALAEAKKAYELSANLSRETRLAIEGRYRAMSNDWDRAIEIYRSVFTFFPDDLDAGLRLAAAQRRGGHPNDAFATIGVLRKDHPAGDPRLDLAEAETARAVSDFPRARTVAARAADAAEKQDARLLVASALLLEASAERNLGNAKSAMPIASKARSIFEAAGDRAGAASATNDLGNSLYDLGDLPGARKTYAETLSMYETIGNRRGQAGALDNMANVLGDQGDFAEARRLAERALAIYRDIDDRAGAAQTLNNIGTALVVQGDYRGAKGFFEQALPLYRATGDRGGLAICLNNVAEMEAGQGDVAGARAHFEEALQIFRDTNQASKTVYPLVGLAGTLHETGDLEAARRTLEPALGICRDAGDRHESSYVLAGLASIDLARDDLAGARRQFEQARGVRDQLGEKDSAIMLRSGLARVLLAEGKPAEAEAVARETAETLRGKKLPDDEATARIVQAIALLELGRPAEARRSLDAARSLVAAGQNDAVKREYEIASSRGRAASGDREGAARALEAAASRAKERGLVATELQARLALVTIESRASGSAAGTERLAALAKDAEAKGFRLIAREARSAPR